MAYQIRAMRQAVNTSTGVQDFTISGFGTVKGAILIGTLGVTDGTAANHACFAVGLTDGTNHRALTTAANNAFIGDSDCRRNARDNGGVMEFDRGDVGRGLATFDSFITDGIRINWTGAPNAAYLLTVILIGGADVSVAVGSFNHGNPNSTITGLAFAPDVVLAFSTAKAFDETNTNDGIMCVGFAADGSPITQGCMSYTSQNAVATTSTSGHITDDSYIASQTVNSTTVAAAAAITDFTSDGFASTLSVGTSLQIAYMALGLTSDIAQVKPIDTPTSTGSRVTSGLNVNPDYVFQLMSMFTAYDTPTTDGESGAIGLGFFNTNEAFSNAIADEDAVASTSDTQSVSDNAAVYFDQHDGTSAFRASLTSLDDTGWTLNYSAVNGTTRKWLALAIGPAAGAAAALHPLKRNKRFFFHGIRP